VKILVTGANGFLGRYVVCELLRRGHAVRALVRSVGAARTPRDKDVELVTGDVRASDLAAVLESMDAVIHLAARMGGGEAEQLQTTVVGTERLLRAMDQAGTARIVLASSYAVYDWHAVSGPLTEASPTVRCPYGRGPYTVAKVWQERIARRIAASAGLDLVVLRPGFVWGSGNLRLSGMSVAVGGIVLVFGRRTLLPLTYVENCADAFAEAVVSKAARGETLNVVDGQGVTAYRYTREYLARTGCGRRPIVVPYRAALGVSRLASALASRVLPGGGNLPDVLVPERFEAQFKPLEFPNDRIVRVLGWAPRVTFGEALERSYPAVRAGARE
jgi:nucleoside-diphosphate-sugar epimerase